MSTKVQLVCARCGKPFHRRAAEVKYAQKNRPECIRHYCSRKCQWEDQDTTKIVTCKQCGKSFIKVLSQIKISKNDFCCHSCSATYNNVHKTTGTRRSKLECWLEQELPVLFPTLEFHFNRKDAINSELDVYIPSLKLAFELNGIYHYEPIHGSNKLQSIQNNDHRKFQACGEVGISLCIIDVSSQKHFSIGSSQQYFDIIKNIVNSQLNCQTAITL